VVVTTDTESGEDVTFTTVPEQVDELRRRVHALADQHNSLVGEAAPEPSSSAIQGVGTATDETDQGVVGAEAIPIPRATVDDVEGGARISVASTNPAQADQVRSAVRAHVMQMQREGCGMMHGS
jgi:hypothetical protein